MPISILGMQELANNLKKYGEVGNAALEAGLDSAAVVLRDAIQDRAPIDNTGKIKHPAYGNNGYVPLRKVRRSGFLYKSIVIQKLESKELADGAPTIRIGPSKGAYYGYFLEFGTAKMPKHPFVRPAYDMASGEALEAAKRAISNILSGDK
jgi:HK97 gp10 family phage protein